MSDELRRGIATLCLFNERTERILSFQFFTDPKNRKSSVVVRYGREAGWEARYFGPEDETVASVVLTARLFMQNNDRLSVGRIAQLYDELPVADELRAAFHRARSELNSFLASPADLAISEKGEMSYSEILEMFVYGDLAHSDEKHAQAIADLRTTPFFGWFKAEFMRALNAVLVTAKEVRILNERAVSALRPG